MPEPTLREDFGDRADEPRAKRSSTRFAGFLTVIAMIVAVLWVYYPLELLNGEKLLIGGDFSQLHQRRIAFAQEALRTQSGTLPAWYPREMCGTPFWSNLQNFPLLPTRLLLIWLFDAWYVMTFGTEVAAILAAVFTYAYARRVGFGPTAAATAGWTFAAAGYFASRVSVGHLPLLEAYPALPLFLWLAECWLQSTSPRQLRVYAVALALSCGCFMLAGHPQIPLYALGVVILYLPLRALKAPGGMRRAVVGVVAIAAGVGCVSFSLYPMVKLVGRSTRVLDLERAENDVTLPYWRLKTFVLPRTFDWGATLSPEVRMKEFNGVGSVYLYDTICYSGLLSIVAVAFLLGYGLYRRQLPTRPMLIVAIFGLGALVFALPWTRDILPDASWTIFRSPARQVYITTFALAIAAGALVEFFDRLRTSDASQKLRRFAAAMLLLAVAANLYDLRHNALQYLQLRAPPNDEQSIDSLDSVGERIAIDTSLIHPMNRKIDDVGVLDSILLAPPYRALGALSNWPVRANRQIFDGAELSPRALRWTGVRNVITTRSDLPGLRLVTRGRGLQIFEVDHPLPRAGFVPASGARQMTRDAIYQAMRNGLRPDAGVIYLSESVALTGTQSGVDPPATSPTTARTAVKYARPGTDDITIEVDAESPGYIRVIESWDPGWQATVDGRSADVLLADGFVMAVPVSAGQHDVRLSYSTPGVTTGIALSIVAVAVLTLIVLICPNLACLRRQ